jgi:hypothetical protein
VILGDGELLDPNANAWFTTALVRDAWLTPIWKRERSEVCGSRTRWRRGCSPAVTPALELDGIGGSDTATRTGARRRSLTASALARSNCDLYVTYELGKCRGGRIRTGGPLRPSATPCDCLRLSATSEPRVASLQADCGSDPLSSAPVTVCKKMLLKPPLPSKMKTVITPCLIES